MVIPFVSIWPNLYTPVPEYRSQQYLKWFELPEYIIELNLVETGRGGLEEIPVLVARLQKYVEYTRAFHLLERLLFCEGGTNKKTHFKSHVLASPVQLPTTAMA